MHLAGAAGGVIDSGIGGRLLPVTPRTLKYFFGHLQVAWQLLRWRRRWRKQEVEMA